VGDGARTVDAAGDVNNDGFMDFIVAARGASPGGVQFAGEAYVVFGKGSGFPATFDANALDGANGFRIQGNVASEQLGVGAGGVGDFNNDGFDDVIVGAINLQGLSGSDTSAYVIFGKASFAATPTISVGTLNGSNGVELRTPHDADNSSASGSQPCGRPQQRQLRRRDIGVANADNSGQTSGAVYLSLAAPTAYDADRHGRAHGTTASHDSSAWRKHRLAAGEAGDISNDGPMTS
jgi:hypothetical protein